MKPNDFEDQLAGLAALEEPVRRQLYQFVVEREGDVSRDEAARATRVSRALAAFHLDKLVDAGLLVSTFRRLSGRAGPGAGRPSKLYRRAPTQFEISLPPRRYELAAHVLAQAFAEVTGTVGLEPLLKSGREWGRRLAPDLFPGAHPRVPLTRAAEALRGCGFEPRQTAPDTILLCNCPFASLQTERREIICNLSLALVEGLLEGLGIEGVEARLTPSPGACCVSLLDRSRR